MVSQAVLWDPHHASSLLSLLNQGHLDDLGQLFDVTLDATDTNTNTNFHAHWSILAAACTSAVYRLPSAPALSRVQALPPPPLPGQRGHWSPPASGLECCPSCRTTTTCLASPCGTPEVSGIHLRWQTAALGCLSALSDWGLRRASK